MSKELEALYEVMQDLTRDEHDDSGFTINEIVDKLIMIKKALTPPTEEETKKTLEIYHEEKHKLSKEARHYIGNFIQKCLCKGEIK